MKNFTIKSIFVHYLKQLASLLDKVPASMYRQSLHEDMFCLAIQARIATNFALRGYCPLVDKEVVTFDGPMQDKQAIGDQIHKTIQYIESLPDVASLDCTTTHSEKAGFHTVTLSQPEFVHQYILPNFFFHISMVYAIARSSGVKISKADFDGLHRYPRDFSFLKNTSN